MSSESASTNPTSCGGGIDFTQARGFMTDLYFSVYSEYSDSFNLPHKMSMMQYPGPYTFRSDSTMTFNVPGAVALLTEDVNGRYVNDVEVHLDGKVRVPKVPGHLILSVLHSNYGKPASFENQFYNLSFEILVIT